MRTDLNLLRLLLAIYEHGNVTLAAKHLGISQPAASASLARLRQSLDDPLFIRSGANMEATPRAQAIIERTREVMEIIDTEILSSPTFDPSTSDHEFTLCLSAVGEVVFLPALFERVRREAPHTRIKTISLAPNQLADALREGTVDAALGYFPDLTGPNIYQQRLFSHDLVCMVRAGHPIKGGRLSLEAFCEADHLQVRDGSRSQEMFETYLSEQHVQRKIALQISHYMSVPSIIQSSDLVVVLPRTVARLYANEAKVRTLEAPLELPTYDLKQYWHGRLHHSPVNVWLRHLVADVFMSA
ncbi:LysR family transcriptional regulator [Pseudomonas sp. zbq_4]|uniref:LysR family transcriptional regulator n=1 Tax=Pseudomonas TaxID=286 RepID=UPI00370AAE55